MNNNSELTNLPTIKIKKTNQRKQQDKEGIPKERQKDINEIIDLTEIKQNTTTTKDTGMVQASNSFISDFLRPKKYG